MLLFVDSSRFVVSDQRLVVAQTPMCGSAPPPPGGNTIASGSSTTIARVLKPARKSIPGSRKAVAWGFGPILDKGPVTGARSGMMRKNCSRSMRSEEHTSELQSLAYLVCRLLLEKKKKPTTRPVSD